MRRATSATSAEVGVGNGKKTSGPSSLSRTYTPATPSAAGPPPLRLGVVYTYDNGAQRIEGLSAKPWRHEPDATSIEARMLGVDTRLAARLLGFQSRLDAEAAVDWTVDWHRRQSDGASALALCEQQISRYEEL